MHAARESDRGRRGDFHARLQICAAVCRHGASPIGLVLRPGWPRDRPAAAAALRRRPGAIEGTVRLTSPVHAPVPSGVYPVAARHGARSPTASEIANVVVFIKDAPARERRADDARDDHAEGRSVRAARRGDHAGSTVEFPNFDPYFHNVFSLSRAASFDLGRYPRGDSRVAQVHERRAGQGLLPHPLAHDARASWCSTTTTSASRTPTARSRSTTCRPAPTRSARGTSGSARAFARCASKPAAGARRVRAARQRSMIRKTPPRLVVRTTIDDVRGRRVRPDSGARRARPQPARIRARHGRPAELAAGQRMLSALEQRRSRASCTRRWRRSPRTRR